MARVLVVGGTGMLAGLARALAARGDDVTVVARRARRTPARTRGIAADCRDAGAFVAAIRAAGPFDVAIVWIHSVARRAPLALARALVEKGGAVRYLHVLGSAAADPSRPDDSRRATFEALPGLAYEEVVLGFVVDGDRPRWLTDDEISGGVLAAVDSPRARTIVGTVTPWTARPR